MTQGSPRTIHIAAALIDDDSGRLLLVRKVGTQWFMQAGGKIEAGESALCALLRELGEEIGLSPACDDIYYLGKFSATAANEADHMVEAEIFHVRINHTPTPCSEIEEVVWVDYEAAGSMPLAPLTRDHVLPLSRTL
jgi:8-oxo-dGTP diphosphatase